MKKLTSSILFCSIIQALFLPLASGQGTNNALTIPLLYRNASFVGTGDFNALIFGNFTASSGDSEGRVAIGGNFSYTDPVGSYSVGIATPGVGSVSAPNNTDNFIVNGNFNNAANDWQIAGNFIYNTATPGITMPVPSSTLASGMTDRVIFSGGGLKTSYQTLSTNLKNISSNGIVTLGGPGDPITLTGTSGTLNVFSVTLPATHETGFEINVPAASTVLINISNTNAVISGGNMNVNSTGIPTYSAGLKVFFNFPNATSVSLASFGLLGSVLAPNASLSADGGSINGQAVIGGNLNQINGFEFHNFDFTGNFSSALPVNLTRFDAAAERGSVELQWTTTTETNSSRFDIEHGLNGKNWAKIGSVASHGESSQARNYSFIDKLPGNGHNLYRLKMIDQDETFSYSRIQHVLMEAGSAVTVFPNPAVDRILISDNSSIKQVTMTDLSGRNIYQADRIPTAGIDCKNLTPGLYILTMTSDNGAIDSHKILIRK